MSDISQDDPQLIQLRKLLTRQSSAHSLALLVGYKNGVPHHSLTGAHMRRILAGTSPFPEYLRSRVIKLYNAVFDIP